jgi:hypothetical protein
MSVYNNAKFFPAALDSILDFAGPDSILLMEGAWNPSKPRRSTDGTVDIVQNVSDSCDIPLIWWETMKLDEYPHWKGNRHRRFVEEALHHPYFHGPTMQQLLMARDMAMNEFMIWYKGNDPGWFFLVDSDEVYQPEQLKELAAFLSVVEDDYDFFTVQGLNFYFSGKNYKPEWYRRLFRIKPTSFFADDNSLESNEGPYTRTMNIPPEIVEFFHYCYIGSDRVGKKLELWNEDAVDKWMRKFEPMLRGEKEYDGSSVHLFGDTNPGYRDYRLMPFQGKHPKSVSDIL